MTKLYLLCGKIAAGKSTLARTLATAPSTVLISEDHWISTLYPGAVRTIDDYDLLSGRLREAMTPHILQLLRQRLSVVLDFPANTREQRSWMRSLIDQADVAHELHWLDVPDAVCKRRLQLRNVRADHPFQASEAEFDLFTSYFEPPAPSERFNVVAHAGEYDD
ncbi:MAG: ATP-binding protein [Mesorhizobium sp.]|nr:ATP-binding protein [Mesorhizobium sp.]MBL8578802.1 ATP-binding protein [Mesorhizobium sp.]